MKIRTLGSTIDGSNYNCAATYLVNDSIAIDAGTIGFAAMPVQRQVKNVFLTHCHLDHTGSLPLFIDNVYQPGPDCVAVHASQSTLDSITRSLFNDIVWPDVVRLSQEESPFLKYVVLEAEHSVEVEGIQVTPVALDHVVPTFGFILDDGKSAVAIVSDTSPTERIWELLSQHPRLQAVFLECAFPDSMLWLAEKAKHLTPSLFKSELAKLSRDIPIVAIHVKPSFHDEVWNELKHIPRVISSSPNHEFNF